MRDFACTPALQRQVFPRRGTLGAGSFTPAAQAGIAVVKELDTRAEEITRRIETSPEPELREAGQAGRENPAEARPVGAAVVALATMDRWNVDWRKVSFADVWIAERGLRFAAEAAVECMGLTTGRGNIQHLEPTQGLDNWWHSPQMRVVMRVRTALAAAPRAEYAEIVQVLAGYRSGHHDYHRLATSLLAPTEPGWVQADVDAAVAARDLFRAFALLQAVENRQQLEELDSVSGYQWSLGSTQSSVATIADGVGSEVLGVFLRWLDQENLNTEAQRELLAVIAQIPAEPAVRALAERVDRKLTPAALLEAADLHPEIAVRVLAETAGPRGPLGEMLRAQVLGHRELAAAALAGLSGAAAERVQAILDEAASVVEAAAETVPAVLLSPSWQNRSKPAKPIVIADLVCADEASVAWREGEREALAGLYNQSYARNIAKNWEELAGKVTAGQGWWYEPVVFFVEAPVEVALPFLASWTPHDYADRDELGPVMARFGVKALPPVLRRARQSPGPLASVLAPYSSPEVAVQMAEWLSRLKSARAAASAWLVRYPAEAARALVPPALGNAGAGRRQAENALLYLAAHGHAESVRAAAQTYGPEVVAAVEVLLARDPLSLLPARIPATPSWAAAGLLPPVRVRDGSGVLPQKAMENLVTIFALSRAEEPYAGLEMVREAVNPDDLAGLAWNLFQRWYSAGAVPKENWAFDALALAGDDEAVRRLTPMILAWPGEGGHARAVTGVNVLAAIGSDVALMHLHGISQRAKFRGLKTAAQEKMAVVAADLGLTAEQLADRLVPGLGLEADGSMVLDYGPRQFVVGFDEQLRPYVADATGKRLRALPKPGAKDDPELAPAAYKQFSALKKDVRRVASDVIQRLESAMVTGRRWSGTEFRQLFVEHPLLWHIVRRLVWGLYDADGALVGAIRVAEDRTFADVEDDTVPLAEDAIVGVVHPVQLDAATSAWSEVFADYEILQPFAQLARPVYTLTPEEAKESNLARFEGLKVPTAKVLGLERRGWRRDDPMDAGIQGRIERKIGASLECSIDLDPGIIVGEPTEWEEQTLAGVYLHDGNSWAAGQKDSQLPLNSLDAVAVSEIFRDLSDITQTA